MKILSLGLDNSVLNRSSALAKRVVEYGGLVERYDIIASSLESEKIELSAKAAAYGSGGGNKLMQFFRVYRIAKKLLREEKYDVVTVQDQYYLALIGLKLARKFKIGLEIQVHGFEKFYGLRKLIAKCVLPRAKAVRSVSQRLKRQLINEFGVKEEKITVVPIFTESEIKNHESRIKKNNGKFIFLTIGRLVPVKNIGLQIEAMRIVAEKYPEAELWIVGEGAEKKNYELRITNYELKDNIKLFGWQNDLEKYYSQADAFLLTSDSEGWGLVVIEAAGFGLPIIMTDVGCAGEFIKDGESGVIIPVGDKQKLVEVMLKIIEDENLRKKLGENAKLAVSRLPGKEQILSLYKISWQMAMADKL